MECASRVHHRGQESPLGVEQHHASLYCSHQPFPCMTGPPWVGAGARGYRHREPGKTADPSTQAPSQA